MPTYFITGTRRGLGRLYVEELSKNASNTIIAHVRSLKGNLADLHAIVNSKDTKANIHLVEASIDSEEDIATLPSQLPEGLRIDYLIVNAAHWIESQRSTPALEVPGSAIRDFYNANVIGTVLIVQQLFESLSHGARIAIISTGMASNGFVVNPEAPLMATAYSMAKGALNVFAVHMTRTVEAERAVVVLFDPGWAKTDMGGPDAMMEPRMSTEGILKTLHAVTKDDHGKWYQYNGSIREW